MSDPGPYFCKHCGGLIGSFDDVPQHGCFNGKEHIYPDVNNDKVLFVEEDVSSNQLFQEYVDKTKENEVLVVKPTGQSAVWTKEAIKALLSLYEANYHILDNPKKKTKLWSIISEGLKDFNIQMTPDQVKWKFNRMLSKYKTCVDNNKRSGRAKMTCEYFKTFEDIFHGNKNIESPEILETQAISKRHVSQEEPPQTATKEVQKKNLDKEEPTNSQLKSLPSMKKKKADLEQAYLEQLKNNEERQKKRDEKLQEWIETKGQRVQLKKRQLDIWEKEMEKKTKRHTEIMKIERKKCKLLAQLMKKKNQSDSDSDTS